MASKKDREDAAKHGHSVTEHQMHKWLLGGAAIAGAVVAAPYVLPALGIGQSLALPASQTHFIMGNLAAPSSAGAMGSGLAGAIQGGIASIPGIGGILYITITSDNSGHWGASLLRAHWPRWH